MTKLVDPEKIEELVGRDRHETKHYARAVTETQTVYILHSQECRHRLEDLRDCWYSRALDNGLARGDWEERLDEALEVVVAYRDGTLVLVPTAAL